MSKTRDVIVIGGGIVGLSSAYYLQEAGYSVHVIEKGDGTDGCSFGNAGFVAPSHFVPLAAPGIVAQGIRWMTNPESPFYIKPRPSVKLMKWGLQFIRHATERHVHQSKGLLRDLLVMSRELHQEIADRHNVNLQRNGIVMLCNTEDTFNREIEISEMAADLDLEAHVLDKSELRSLDPAMNVRAIGGVYFPCDAYVEPREFMSMMTKVLLQRGVSVTYNTEAVDFVKSNGHVKEVVTPVGHFSADEVVIAAGSFTPPLLKHLGLDLLMEAGKGYSVDWTSPAVVPTVSYILVEARVGLAPMKNKVRMAGTMELGGMNLVINERRVAGFLKSIEAYFPDYSYEKLKGLKAWAGLRPCSPDGLPFLGRCRRFTNVTVATGHSMLGFGLGPVTGKLVSEVVEGKTTTIPVEELSLYRF
jgi:D-amino-acid dehydrogenase